jgi:hypothetical protein
MSSLAHVAFHMCDTEIAEDVAPDIHFNLKFRILYFEIRDL